MPTLTPKKITEVISTAITAIVNQCRGSNAPSAGSVESATTVAAECSVNSFTPPSRK